MSNKKAQEQKLKKVSDSSDLPEATIDLTNAVNAEPPHDIDVSLLDKPDLSESIKPPRTKKGAEEILNMVNKGKPSEKMIDLDLATELAKLEGLRDVIDVTKAETAAERLSKIPQPDWVKHPRPRTRSGDGEATSDGVARARELYRTFSENQVFLKITKLTECMKHMRIEVNPLFLKEWYMESLPAKAAALGARVVEVPAVCFRAISMSRNLPRELVSNKGKMLQLSESRKNSMRFMYIMVASEVASRLKSRELTSHMSARKRILGGQITLIILDCAEYFKKGKPQIELEKAITDLILTLRIDTTVVNSPDELVTFILQFTRAVAEEPAKLAKRAVDEEAEFYMRGDNKNCVTVDQQGNGLDRLWQQMLSVLPQSSLEVSRSISAKYPSPRALADALSTDQGVTDVADTGVLRSTAPNAKPRRLGPEMANKLRILFTTKDGNTVVE